MISVESLVTLLAAVLANLHDLFLEVALCSLKNSLPFIYKYKDLNYTMCLSCTLEAQWRCGCLCRGIFDFFLPEAHTLRKIRLN